MCWTRALKAHPTVPDCTMIDWDDVRYFLAVARGGSVRAAAERGHNLIRYPPNTLSGGPDANSGVVLMLSGDIATHEAQRLCEGFQTPAVTHLGPTVAPEDDYRRHLNGTKKFFPGPIVLAKDLMRF
jgi:hypothetical protein